MAYSSTKRFSMFWRARVNRSPASPERDAFHSPPTPDGRVPGPLEPVGGCREPGQCERGLIGFAVHLLQAARQVGVAPETGELVREEVDHFSSCWSLARP